MVGRKTIHSSALQQRENFKTRQVEERVVWVQDWEWFWLGPGWSSAYLGGSSKYSRGNAWALTWERFPCQQHLYMGESYLRDGGNFYKQNWTSLCRKKKRTFHEGKLLSCHRHKNTQTHRPTSIEREWDSSFLNQSTGKLWYLCGLIYLQYKKQSTFFDPSKEKRMCVILCGKRESKKKRKKMPNNQNWWQHNQAIFDPHTWHSTRDICSY